MDNLGNHLKCFFFIFILTLNSNLSLNAREKGEFQHNENPLSLDYWKNWYQQAFFPTTELLKQILPYTILNNDQQIPLSRNNNQVIDNADVILIGGEEAQLLGLSLAPELKSQGISFFSLSQKGLTIARAWEILSKIQWEKLSPKSIIFFFPPKDDREELYDKEDEKNLRKNLEYLDQNWFLLMGNISLKIASFFTSPYKHRIQLEVDPQLTVSEKSDVEKSLRLEMHQKILSHLFQNLFFTLTKNHMKILGMSSPYPILERPKKACRLGLNFQSKKTWNQLQNYMEEKNWDMALTQSETFIRTNPFHPIAYFSRGLIFLEKKQYENSIKELERAKLLDCSSTSQGTPIWNRVLREKTLLFNQTYYDFAHQTFEMQLTGIASPQNNMPNDAILKIATQVIIRWIKK